MPTYCITNSLAIQDEIATKRIRDLDPLASIDVGNLVTEDGTSVAFFIINTSISPTAALTALSSPITASEQQLLTNYAAAIQNFNNLPNWATWQPSDVDTVVGGILLGWDKPTADAWISTNVVDLASTKTALTNLANAVIDLRTVAVAIAKAILFIRDLIFTLRRN